MICVFLLDSFGRRCSSLKIKLFIFKRRFDGLGSREKDFGFMSWQKSFVTL